MTTGEAGFRTQTRGLGKAFSDTPRELVTRVRPPFSLLPGGMTPCALKLLTADSDRPVPPWPDLVISSGRRAAAVAIAVRRAAGGRTLAVHIQDPLTSPRHFDLVVAMAHDGLAGANVISVQTALHDMTPARLTAAADQWRGRLRPDSRPLIGVLLGGPTRRRGFPQTLVETLIDGLERIRAATGARLAITPSRRTPEGVRQRLAERFAGEPEVFLWDFQGDNPYAGILALSDRLVVTCDSVSMISEALATHASVEVLGDAGAGRHGRFIRRLIETGKVRRFAGEPTAAPPGGPIDSTAQAAAAVRQLLAERTGASG